MTQLTHLNTSLKIDSFSHPDKVARNLTVKTLSKNLLRKYGLSKEADEEGESTGESTGTGSGTVGAKPKEEDRPWLRRRRNSSRVVPWLPWGTGVCYNIDPLENIDPVADPLANPLAVSFFFQFFILPVTWFYVHKLVYICNICNIWNMIVLVYVDVHGKDLVESP